MQFAAGWPGGDDAGASGTGGWQQLRDSGILYQGNLVEEYRRADESCQEDEAAVIAQTDTFEGVVCTAGPIGV